jgi:hypothetical protein
MDAIGQRMVDIKAKTSAESRFLDACLGYIMGTSFIVNPNLVNAWSDRRDPDALLARFHGLLKKLPGLPDESRHGLHECVQFAISELEKLVGRSVSPFALLVSSPDPAIRISQHPIGVN